MRSRSLPIATDSLSALFRVVTTHYPVVTVLVTVIVIDTVVVIGTVTSDIVTSDIVTFCHTFPVSIIMNYCSHCGSDQLILEVPEGDNRPRYCCHNCHTIHYQNPHVVVGALPVWEDRFLLCRRAIEPRKGYWTLPAGFHENGETLEQGAIRETKEEACANIIIDDLYTVFSLPHINQVYMFFRSHLDQPDFAIGCESLEVSLFDADDIPWKELAFPVVKRNLILYLEDRKKGKFPVRHETIAPLKLS
jgi:ADP-ribose pyrophosphatase YjhB (NUDIX family)